MCRHVSDNERLEHRLEELEKNVDVSEAVQDFVDEKMQEQLELLEEKVAELEEKLEKTQDFRHIPQKNRLKLIADQRKEQESVSEVGEMISVEE
jgi:uncharacterized coiled-coil protein SlyX